jgi:hypothetical protein
MEDLDSETESRKNANSVGHLARRLGGFGLFDKLIIFRQVERPGGCRPEIEFLSTTPGARRAPGHQVAVMRGEKE